MTTTPADPARIRELVERTRATLQEMASTCSVPMELWDRHSNAVLEAATALEALAEPLVAWERIDSAPKDGTHILLAFGQDTVAEGWYDDNDLEPRPWRFVDTGGPGQQADGFINASRDGAYGPSHWRHLPAAPGTAALHQPPEPRETEQKQDRSSSRDHDHTARTPLDGGEA